MIVKNESHVIAKTLDNILQHVPLSFYVISDTGSTDNTEEIIKDFFRGRNIPGYVTNDPWQDFATNRTIAIQHAQRLSTADYLFIFDADDSIHGTVPALFHSKLYDSYQFTFGDNVTYTRPLLIRASLPWRFRCVLHEYLHLDQPHSQFHIQGNYHVDSGRTGDRNKNPRKYINDALVFERAIDEALSTGKDADLLNRYYFYLAQSYRDAHQMNHLVPCDYGIKTYKHVTTL
jgi:glycosyltransferase involved in cell wall biosynthesis